MTDSLTQFTQPTDIQCNDSEDECELSDSNLQNTDFFIALKLASTEMRIIGQDPIISNKDTRAIQGALIDFFEETKPILSDSIALHGFTESNPASPNDDSAKREIEQISTLTSSSNDKSPKKQRTMNHE
jgi:hypothetical protein